MPLRLLPSRTKTLSRPSLLKPLPLLHPLRLPLRYHHRRQS